MPLHSIGTAADFEFWEPHPPVLTKQNIVNFTKPGVNGAGQQLTGIWGKQFEVQLTAHFPSYLDAIAAMAVYRALIGIGPQEVVYNTINFYSAFGHKYSVDDWEPIGNPKYGNFIGPDYRSGQTYIYEGGTEIISRFLLTPFTS